MSRVLLLTVAVLCGGGVLTAAQAQKIAPLVTRDSDRDGVPDTRDRCRTTAAGRAVDANGCDAPAPQPNQVAANPRPDSTPPRPPVAPNTTTTRPPRVDSAPKPGNRPTGLPTQPGNAAVTTQATPTPPVTTPTVTPTVTPTLPVNTAGNATQPANTATRPTPPAEPPPPPTPPSETAGFWIPPYLGGGDSVKLEYARAMAIKIDTAIVALVTAFRGTTGQPVAGADGPGSLGVREKNRWERCRLISLDLIAIGEAVGQFKDTVDTGSPLSRHVTGLADAFGDMQSLGECDQVAMMITAPGRALSWATSYAESVRAFYRDWYPQVRAVHEANRGLARALNSALPAGRRLPALAALPVSPPMVGGAAR